ncbi:Crp/Fnr family transcriptional regulator [Kordia sp.]|uniref:Crp/Fnr family transcriptional regulator n=1 Tax=Kordia sp. TaxID=1965332 RepID=UPI003D2C2112
MNKCEQCIVKEFHSLKSLTQEELIRISDCKTSKVIKKEQPIFNEGDTMNGVFCVRKGICKLTKLSANGNIQIVKLVVKGDLLGQRSLVSKECANLSATALSDMQVCFIPKREIIRSLNENTNFSMDILKSIAIGLRESDNVIVNMVQKPVRQRLSEALLYIYTTFGTTDDGMLSIILSREDYSNLVGTATESAIRILSQFKKDGLISTKGKQIKIEDIDGLKRVK